MLKAPFSQRYIFFQILPFLTVLGTPNLTLKVQSPTILEKKVDSIFQNYT